jgi:hypothetical protein
MTEDFEFVQLVGSRKLYHLDVEHLDGTELPLATKPTWALTHFHPDGSPAPILGTLETSVDSRTGRIITGNQPGIIVITVNANVSPTAHASTTFKIQVKAHPLTTSLLKFKIASHRDAPIH